MSAMNQVEYEKFIRRTANWVLRKCYIKSENIQLAEEFFTEIYVAWAQSSLSTIPIARYILLDYEVRKHLKT